MWVTALLALLAGPSATLAGPLEAAEQTAGHSERTVTISYGQSSPDDFSSIVTSPWSVSFEDTGIVIASLSQRLGQFGEYWSLGGEAGVGRRFGDSDAWEFFALAFLRWDGFGWRDRLYTSIGIGLGPSFATEVSDTERRKSGNDEGSRTLNLLVPEIAVGIPEVEHANLVFRLHHRSGVFGLYNGVEGGSTFVSMGVQLGF